MGLNASKLGAPSRSGGTTRSFALPGAEFPAGSKSPLLTTSLGAFRP